MGFAPIRGLALAGIAFTCHGLSPEPARGATPEQADQSILAFTRTYWNAGGKYFHKRDDRTGVLDFWLSANAWETLMDAYARTRKEEHRLLVRDMYDGFVARHGTDWTRNDYNDDIAWWIIAAARAYEVTGESRYLIQAKSQFDWVYRTQRDSVKGGIWWKNTEHNEKNSCVVQPMIISAVALARHLKDETYRAKAESLYAWQQRTLVDVTTGQVHDRIMADGTLHKGATTYNQGTYIGASVGLGRLADARKAADWTRTNMCTPEGIFREKGQGDFGGFKPICIRYIVGLGRQTGGGAYLAWMEANAAKLWSNRRADGIMGHDWNAMTPASGIEAQCASGGVSLLNLLATSTSVSLRPPGRPADSRTHAGGQPAAAVLADGRRPHNARPARVQFPGDTDSRDLPILFFRSP